MSRYETLLKTEPNEYIETCPVLIEKYAILKDNKLDNILLQAKYKRIRNKNIKGLIISVETFDVKGEVLEGVDEFQYLDIDNQNLSFGDQTPIKLPNPNTRKCKINIKEIVYDDNTFWKNNNSNIKMIPDKKTIDSTDISEIWSDDELNDLMPKILESKQTNEAIHKETIEQYSSQNGGNKFLYNNQKYYWICSCGELNDVLNATCCSCGKSKEELEQQQDFSNIKALITDKLINEKIDYDKSVEEQKRQAKIAEAARIEKEKRMRKTKKIALITVISVAVIAGASFGGYHLYTDVIRPNGLYNDIEQLLKDNKYEEAQTAINNFNKEYKGYKDSSKFQKAIDDHKEEVVKAELDKQITEINDLLVANKFDDAHNLYIKLPFDSNYKNQVGKMLNDYICNKAETYYNNGQYKKAFDTLKQVITKASMDTNKYNTVRKKAASELYREAMKRKKYSTAVNYASYTDDKTKSLDAKYKYVKLKNKQSSKVAEYLGDLVKANYKDSKKINNKLYNPYVKIKVNIFGKYYYGDSTLYGTNSYNKYICVKMYNYNNFVNKKGLKIYYVITYPGYSSGKKYFEEKRLGNKETTSSDSWMMSGSGYRHIKVYNKDTKELLGEKTIYIH